MVARLSCGFAALFCLATALHDGALADWPGGITIVFSALLGSCVALAFVPPRGSRSPWLAILIGSAGCAVSAGFELLLRLVRWLLHGHLFPRSKRIVSGYPCLMNSNDQPVPVAHYIRAEALEGPFILYSALQGAMVAACWMVYGAWAEWPLAVRVCLGAYAVGLAGGALAALRHPGRRWPWVLILLGCGAVLVGLVP